MTDLSMFNIGFLSTPSEFLAEKEIFDSDNYKWSKKVKLICVGIQGGGV